VIYFFLFFLNSKIQKKKLENFGSCATVTAELEFPPIFAQLNLNFSLMGFGKEIWA